MIKTDVNSIFTTEYWKASASEFHKLKTLVFVALTIALSTIITPFNIPVSENLHISFTFLIFILGSMIFGPIVGLSAGVLYDILGFIISPSVFFPGYTLSWMLEFFIYGLFFYHRQISILRIFIAKFITNFGIHVILGSLWSKILFGKAYYFYFAKSFVKNSIMLPIEVIMIVVMLQILLPILTHEGIMPKQKTKYIPFI